MDRPTENRGVRPGKHEKGRRKAEYILEQATEVLIGEGYSRFSLRQVANAAGVTLGNVQYYFPTKSILVEAMLGHVITGYIEEFNRLMAEVDGRPEEQLAAVLTHVIRDLTSPRTTVLFPELWSMANHDPAVEQYVEDMYESYRRIVAGLIPRINPRLTPGQVRLLTIFITSAIEGHTPFTGHGKRWEYLTPGIEQLTIETFLKLVEGGRVPEVPCPGEPVRRAAARTGRAG